MNSNWSCSLKTPNLGQNRRFFSRVTLKFNLWPWPFAWMSLLSLVITPQNFMMIRWREHSQKGVTDRRTDRKYHSQSCLVAAKNQWGTSPRLHQALCIISKPLVNSNWSHNPEMLNSGKNWWFFVPCDLEIWWMTLKNSRAPLLCYFKLGASFHSHRSSQTGVRVRKRQIWVKIDHFLSHVTSKFDGWPWKTIGLLSLATSSFVHHFIAIGQFKLELQSGNRVNWCLFAVALANKVKIGLAF